MFIVSLIVVGIDFCVFGSNLIELMRDEFLNLFAGVFTYFLEIFLLCEFHVQLDEIIKELFDHVRVKHLVHVEQCILCVQLKRSVCLLVAWVRRELL